MEFSKPDKITQCSPLSFYIAPYTRLKVGVYLIIYCILKWMTSILTAWPHMRLSASLISSSISVTWYDTNKFKLEICFYVIQVMDDYIELVNFVVM